MQIQRDYNISGHFAWNYVLDLSLIVNYNHCNSAKFEHLVCSRLLSYKVPQLLQHNVKHLGLCRHRHASLG